MKNKAAVSLGRLGGQVKSSRKTSACRLNGIKGGAPSKLGVSNWIKFFDAVASLRRSRRFTDLQRQYDSSRRPREKALLQATVYRLAREMKLAVPKWVSEERHYLRQPYFVAGVDNLMASALLESPPEFRANNVFVLGNFLDRI